MKYAVLIVLCLGAFWFLRTGGGGPPAEGNVDLTAITTVVDRDGQAQDFDAALAGKDYVFVYFSAHWCPPCRTFTPKLVDFYNQAGPERDFELVFVSGDRSEDDMFGYMGEAEMPWLALPYNQRVQAAELQAVGGARGIPNLLLLSSDGEVLAASYDGGRYLGPTRALDVYRSL